ncbi:hypothetical protein LA080_008855 [Diaporthe eres]|nr:hypothetical protein LA080_008855 [Diaporthe eres]
MVGNDGMSATERKRIRDRRAQQKHRERKDLYTKQLEDQVASCQRNHEPANIQLLMEKVRQLEAVNETLVGERDRLLNLANHFQEYLTTFFSINQDHRHVNARTDFSKSFSSSTASPMSEACQPGINVTPVCDSNSTSRGETDVTATRRQIPMPREQPLSTGSNDGDVRAVDSVDAANTAISDFVGTEALVTNGLQPLSTDPSIYPSPTPAIRDYRALGTPSGEQTRIQTVDEDFSPTSIDHLSQTPFTTTAILIEQDGTQHTSLSTSAASPETRLTSSAASDESVGISVPIANISWLSLPANTVTHEPCKFGCSWLNFPHAVADAPDVPQPEDLLFGSCKNLLANGIHEALRTARVAEPERLAMGWVSYIFSRWRIIPTRENFARMPHFLRPTAEQIIQPHPPRIDMIPWPSLRIALMSQHSDSQLDEILELLACCLKLRWPWGKEFLRMRDDGSRELVDEFLQMVMSLDGWGITREFAVAYPNLVEGLKLHIIEYNVA